MSPDAIGGGAGRAGGPTTTRIPLRRRRVRVGGPTGTGRSLGPRGVLVLVLVGLALAIPIPARPVGAQERADVQPGRAEDAISRVAGRLLDAGTGAPVKGALLALEPVPRRAVSDSSGRFVLPDVPPGSYRITIRHIAYGERAVEVAVRENRTTWLDLRIDPEAIALEPLRVTVESEFRPRFLERAGFYDRMGRGWGTYFDPEFVERWGVGYASSAGFLQNAVLVSSPGFANVRISRPRAAPAPEFPGGACVYIDARRDRSGRYAELSTREIGAVEVYSGSAAVPDFAAADQGDTCIGAIAIWNRRWETRTRASSGVELCGEDPGGRVVEGTVRDALTDVPLPGARVTAAPAARGGAAERGRATERGETTAADADGRYRFCGLPGGGPLLVWATFAGRTGPYIRVEPGPRGHEVAELTIEVAGPGRIVGRVTDREAGRPVAAAAIALRGTTVSTRTDGQGWFVLEDAPPGDHALEVTHLGYATLVDSVSIRADRTVDVRAELSADPVMLEPILVTALRDLRLERRGFYDRRDWGERVGTGRFFDEEEIRQRGPALLSHLVGEQPGMRLECQGSTRGCAVKASTASTCSHATVYLDGIRIIEGDAQARRAGTIDEFVRPFEVAAVEVYAGAASLPAEFGGPTGHCGVVAIWTR